MIRSEYLHLISFMLWIQTFHYLCYTGYNHPPPCFLKPDLWVLVRTVLVSCQFCGSSRKVSTSNVAWTNMANLVPWFNNRNVDFCGREHWHHIISALLLSHWNYEHGALCSQSSVLWHSITMDWKQTTAPVFSVPEWTYSAGSVQYFLSRLRSVLS